MEYKIAHGVSLDKKNNSLTYSISYMDKQGQTHIVLTSVVYKGVGNTQNNSIYLSQEGHDVLYGMISNIVSGQEKNDAYKALMSVNNVSGGTLSNYFWQINNLLTGLKIFISNYAVNQTKSVSDFLTAWQGNRNTLVLLPELVKNGWLPREILAAEESRLASIDWLKADSIVSRVREYFDRVEGIFVFSSSGQDIIRVELINTIADPLNLQVLLKVSSVVMDRIKQNIFGDYAEWVNLKINKQLSLSEINYEPISKEAHNIFSRFYELLLASNVSVDRKAILGIIALSKTIFSFSLVYRNVYYREKNALSLLEGQKTSINLGFDKQEEKDAQILAKTMEYNQEIARIADYKAHMLPYGSKQLISEIANAQSAFVLPIVYERFSVPFAEESRVEKVVPMIEQSAETKISVDTTTTTPVPVTIVSSAPVVTVPEKRGNFWSEVLTGVTVGVATMWIMKDKSK